MSLIESIIEILEPYRDLITVIISIMIAYIVFNIILKILKRKIVKKVRGKKQISNVIVFLDILKFLFIIFLIIIAFSVYYGNLGEIGFIVGLLTVAIGWALQKPISGVVAWLIIISRKPFRIGDRIIISNVIGEVTNISMTHIFLNEVGGTILGEEKSGRTVMIPTSIIFEEQVTNYTEKNDYILDEVNTTITYESNLEKAEDIIQKSVEKIMNPLWEKFPKKIEKRPHTRLKFKDSGIDVTVRYNSITDGRNKISTDITREIFKRIKKTYDVEIAYPHTEVVFRKKNTSKK
jgi:small-conductance mechanosensitive channel